MLYIYIYIQHVPFFNGNWETFQYLWGKFSRSKLWTQMFFSSGSFMHVWKKRCKLAWFLWSPFLGISIKQPTSSLVNSKRQGDDFAMRKWVTKAAPIDFYKMMSFFGVRSVVFFSSARIASRSWLTCKECWTWKQLLNSLTRLLGLYRDCSRSVEPIVVVEQIESWVCWTSLPVLYLRQGICYHVLFQSFRWLYNYIIR